MTRNPKILTVVGTRPQFIKAAPVSLALKEAGLTEVLVNTGQHYDAAMCDVFFEQLDLLPPAYHLDIGSGTHGYQTGEGLIRLEPIIDKEKPDAMLVYGDTNATLAGALTAAKLHVPLAHVEAGLRSFNRRMPEEINRIVTDHVSTWLFAPTRPAVEHLAKEGIVEGVHWTGDVMLDAALLYRDVARAQHAEFLQSLGLTPGSYALLTMHRAETTAAPEQAAAVLRMLDRQGWPVLFPVHPRIRPLVREIGPFRHIRLSEPLGYFEMLLAEESARVIITDSGGVQKEAAFFEVPCITLREETEWVETVESGWNRLTGLSTERLQAALDSVSPPASGIRALYGNGEARHRMAGILQAALTGPAAIRS